MTRRLALAGVIVSSLLLHAPALRMGFYADDYVHQLALDGELPMRPTALYDFGDFSAWQELDVGTFPWWTSSDGKARFFRPLSSVSLMADHALFGRWALGYQLTSFALFALLLVLLRVLYRALGLSDGVGLLAVALFGVSTATVIPIVWPANRNTLLAVLFTVAAVVLALRDPSARGRVLALACATCAVLSKESGIVAFVLLALLFVRARAARPWIAACVGLSVAHVAFLVAMGYGTRSLFYATPWSDPGRYLTNLAVLAPTSVVGLTTPLSLDLVAQHREYTLAFAVGALVLAVPIVVFVRRHTRGAPSVGFLAVWTLLALLPQAGVVISDRLLFFPAVGGAALLAIAIAHARREASVFSRAGAWALVLTAGVLSALGTLGVSTFMTTMAGEVRRLALDADVGPTELGRRQVFVLQSPSMFAAFSMASVWGVESEDHDLRFHIVQVGGRGFRWTREDERTFTLETTDTAFLTNPFERVYLSSEDAAAPGTRFECGLFDVEVVEGTEEGPPLLRFAFAEPLDDPRLRFLIWKDGRLTHVAPPAVGDVRDVPAAPPISPFVP